MLEAYRSYLVRNLHAARCADSGDAAAAQSLGMLIQAETPADPVVFFNETLRVDPVKPITAEEIQPTETAGTAGGLRACESPECRDLARLYRGLILGPNGMPFGPEQRAGEEWHARLKQYLGALADWNQDSGGGTGSLFQQKCMFYSDLFNLAPNGAEREGVVRQFVDFLRQNTYQRENRMEWLLPVGSVIARVFLDPGAMGNLMRELRQSAEPDHLALCRGGIAGTPPARHRAFAAVR